MFVILMHVKGQEVWMAEPERPKEEDEGSEEEM